MTKLFRQFCSVVVSTILVTAPQLTTYAQSQSTDFTQVPTSGSDGNKISQAVMADVNQVVQSYALKKQSSRLSASDVDMAAAVMKIAFDHLQEVGYTGLLEKKILSNEQAYLGACRA
ncbi:MAG: hypothetical protein ACP5E2_03705 [Terracidiphilus sp.]